MQLSRRRDKKFRHVVENIRLLQGGSAYFPAMIEAIDKAGAWVQLETYLFDTYGAGAEVASALVRAAERGVRVQVLVDGVGTQPLPADWQEKMRQAGVEWCVYSQIGRAHV